MIALGLLQGKRALITGGTTGLGLAVVQQIVLAHGWEIECLSNEPRGAVFRITHLRLASTS